MSSPSMNCADKLAAWDQPEETLEPDNGPEPLRIPCSIQPHGALVVLDLDGHVLQASSNLTALLGVSASTFSTELARTLARTAPGDALSGGRTALEWEFPAGTCTVVGHQLSGTWVCELEPELTGVSPLRALRAINQLSQRLAQAEDEASVFAIAVNAVAEIIGFDRVMAYVFDDEGHGSVDSEVVRDGVERYLGLRFPATDIPLQARKLYALEHTRLIADVGAQSVPIEPRINPVTGRPLNMSFCHLRSVSMAHLQYLRNIGVHATCSLSVVVDGELVALIEAHHLAPRGLDANTRSACEMVSRLLSTHISQLRYEARRTERNRQLSAQIDLVCELGGSEGIKPEVWQKAFTLVQADALLIRTRQGNELIGTTPAQLEQLWALGDRLHRDNPQQITDLTNTQAFEPQLNGGGLLLVPIQEDWWIAWYRQPQDQVVRWAGVPDQPDAPLTPRQSFSAWQKAVAGCAERWQGGDLEMAELLRRGFRARLGESSESGDSFERAMSQMREYVVFLEEQNRALGNANADLRQFARIASHDMRGPLRTIQSFLPMIRQRIGPWLTGEAEHWMNFVDSAAAAMHRLQDGLWTYSNIKHDEPIQCIALGPLVDEIVASLAGGLEDVDLTISALPETRGIASQLEMLFRNLIQNAAKYREPSRRLKLIIDHRQDDGVNIFSVTDNGMGFPPAASEQIFDLFSRLHPKVSDGDGLGLAICKRIVHHHRGWIRAHADPGQGATFEFLLREPATDLQPAS